MEELTTETQAKRPVLLTVLVILSAIYIIGSLLAVTSALISGPLSEEALETELEGLYELSAELSANGAGEQLAGMTNTIIDNAVYINNEVFMLSHTLSLITLIIGAIGVFMMFNLKKIGFHLYVIYSLLPIITMYIITPMELIITFSVISAVVLAALFSVLYGLNLKHMK